MYQPRQHTRPASSARSALALRGGAHNNTSNSEQAQTVITRYDVKLLSAENRAGRRASSSSSHSDEKAKASKVAVGKMVVRCLTFCGGSSAKHVLLRRSSSTASARGEVVSRWAKRSRYEHAHHAGNTADMMKHVVLGVLLRRMLVKSKPFVYVDSHAGAGLYDLQVRVGGGRVADDLSITPRVHFYSEPRPLATRDPVRSLRAAPRARRRDRPAHRTLARVECIPLVGGARCVRRPSRRGARRQRAVRRGPRHERVRPLLSWEPDDRAAHDAAVRSARGGVAL